MALLHSSCYKASLEFYVLEGSKRRKPKERYGVRNAEDTAVTSYVFASLSGTAILYIQNILDHKH